MIKKVLSFQRCLPNFHQTNVRYIKKQIPLSLKKKKKNQTRSMKNKNKGQSLKR